MTYMMTHDGWKPLFDVKAKTAPIHAEIAVKRENLNAAKALPTGTEDERRTQHFSLMQAYGELATAENRLLGQV